MALVGTVNKNRSVSFFGSSTDKSQTIVWQAMYKVAGLLAEQGMIRHFVAGGYHGSGMEAPAQAIFDKAKAGRRGNPIMEGLVLNTQQDEDLFPNRFCRPHQCGIGHPNHGYGERIDHLLASDILVFGAGGDLGTIVELMAVIDCRQKIWSGDEKQVAIMHPENFRGESYRAVLEKLWVPPATQPIISKEDLGWIESITFPTPEELVQYALQ